MNRLKNIDQLKGFAILLVVIGHVFVYSFGNANTLLFNWLSSFHMPLFMFLSGYMAYNSSLKSKSIVQLLKNKALALLLPFFLFGIFYTWSFDLTWYAFFCGSMKLGYWFTFTLFEIFCIYYFICYLFQKINKCKNIWSELFGFIMVYALIECIRLFKLLPKDIDNFLDMYLLTTYIKYFILGVFVRKCAPVNLWLNRSNICFTAMLILFVILFLINQTEYTNVICRFLVGVAGTWCSFYLITRYSETLPFGKQLAYMGTRSLDIYVIHYFFLMSLSNLFPSDLLNNITLQVFVPLFLALMVIALSLFTSQIIRSSDWLALLLLGQRKRK